MTAFGPVQAAVEAMKQGAYDYLQKPFEPDEALLVVRRAAERKHLRTRLVWRSPGGEGKIPR